MYTVAYRLARVVVHNLILFQANAWWIKTTFTGFKAIAGVLQ
jgi:hypothetical protein